jgi:hypothetical protein
MHVCDGRNSIFGYRFVDDRGDQGLFSEHPVLCVIIVPTCIICYKRFVPWWSRVVLNGYVSLVMESETRGNHTLSHKDVGIHGKLSPWNDAHAFIEMLGVRLSGFLTIEIVDFLNFWSFLHKGLMSLIFQHCGFSKVLMSLIVQHCGFLFQVVKCCRYLSRDLVT